LDVEALASRLTGMGKRSVTDHLRRALRLPPVALALVNELARPLPRDPGALAALVKSLPVPLRGPMDMDGAISTAGGLRWDTLDGTLMLRDRPGTFAAGEMIDWEAPTGGWLITASMATGRLAGLRAAAWAARDGGSSGAAS
jgi:predicted flavoprotein YhiN